MELRQTAVQSFRPSAVTPDDKPIGSPHSLVRSCTCYWADAASCHRSRCPCFIASLEPCCQLIDSPHRRLVLGTALELNIDLLVYSAILHCSISPSIATRSSEADDCASPSPRLLLSSARPGLSDFLVMEQVHGIDVSWMTQASPKGKRYAKQRLREMARVCLRCAQHGRRLKLDWMAGELHF